MKVIILFVGGVALILSGMWANQVSMTAVGQGLVVIAVAESW